VATTGIFIVGIIPPPPIIIPAPLLIPPPPDAEADADVPYRELK
jgi:hypothetical protein